MRFDFAFSRALTSSEISAVESMINSIALEDDSVVVETMPKDKAVQSGALAMFGEKYGDEARVVSIGSFSKELCGGTHVSTSREFFPFVVLSEGAIASGTRRIEAAAGVSAIIELQRSRQCLAEVADRLKVHHCSQV